MIQGYCFRPRSYPFRGFFIYSLPSQLEHDYMWTPVERVTALEKVPTSTGGPKRLIMQERQTTVVCVHGRMHEIPQPDLDRMARLQLAFLAVMDEHAALIAVQQFVDLIQGGIFAHISQFNFVKNLIENALFILLTSQVSLKKRVRTPSC
jgi:hypothetical protein